MIDSIDDMLFIGGQWDMPKELHERLVEARKRTIN